MRRRVRWGNVIRASAVALLAAIVVAWPRLAPPAPEVPAPEPAPLVGDEGETAHPPPTSPRVAPPRDRTKGGRADDSRAQTGGTRKRAAKAAGEEARGPRERRRPATRGGGRAPAAGGDERGQAPTRGGGQAPATNAPPLDPAETEFGFETG